MTCSLEEGRTENGTLYVASAHGKAYHLSVEPSVIATRHGTYRSLFDRRSGLLARFLTNRPLPSPELIEISLVGQDGELFDLGELRSLLESATLCRQLMLVGNSDSHPALASILRTVRDHGVVPAVVVSDPKPSSGVVNALTRFAGFVSIDCGFNRTQIGLARTYRDAGLRVCLNLPLADASADWLANALENEAFEHLVQGAVLTGRTASGPGCQGTGLSSGPSLDRLVELVSRSHPFRLGADARIAPYLSSGDIGHAATIPRCEAALGGLFVNHDLTVTPCSLLPGVVLGSLESSSLDGIWSSKAAKAFRNSVSGALPPCFETRTSVPPAPPDSEAVGEANGLELRFGFSSSSICDRSILPLNRGQLIHIMTSVKDWRALRFFTEDANEPTQVAASWSSLEYFLSLPPLWGQDLARLHEQLVAGTFEGQVAT